METSGYGRAGAGLTNSYMGDGTLFDKQDNYP